MVASMKNTPNPKAVNMWQALYKTDIFQHIKEERNCPTLFFADDIFVLLLCDARYNIWIQISLEFINNGPIDNHASLVQCVV